MTTLGNSRLEDLRKFLDGFCFTVLHHALPATAQRSSHWDLLMEHPSLDAEKVLCFEALTPVSCWAAPTKLNRLPNHRKKYLTYEGPISQGRGHVTQVATGALTWLPSSQGSLHALLLNIERPVTSLDQRKGLHGTLQPTVIWSIFQSTYATLKFDLDNGFSPNF